MHKKVEFILRKVLHFFEGTIAVMTLLVMWLWWEWKFIE